MFIPPPHHHLLKRILFPIGCSWLHYQILVDSVCRNLILGSVLLVSVHFYATTIPFKIIYYYCSFVVQSKTGHDTSGFVIFSEKCFDYLQTLSLHINFEIFFFYFCKEYHWYFDGDCVESTVDFEQYR